jgi:hypothetical protein
MCRYVHTAAGLYDVILAFGYVVLYPLEILEVIVGEE